MHFHQMCSRVKVAACSLRVSMERLVMHEIEVSDGERGGDT